MPETPSQGEPSGSTTGSKVYTEAELQSHVGAAQSSLAKQLAVVQKAHDEAAAKAATLEGENAEFKARAKDAPTTVAQLAKEKELTAREQRLADTEAVAERIAEAAALGVKPEALADFTVAELRLAKKLRGLAPKPDTNPKPNRGSGGTTTGPATAHDLIEQARARKR